MSQSQFPLLEKCNPRNCLVSKTMKISRLMNQLFRKYLVDFKITNSQLSILFVLGKRGNISQHELGELLFLEKSTISRNINLLIRDALLTKKKDKLVYITYKGKKLLERIIPKWEQAMNEARQKIAYDGEEALLLLLNKLST